MNNLVWLIPSFYGDLRLEAMAGKKCRLIVQQATVSELEALKKLQEHAVKKGWCPETTILGEGPASLLSAPIEKVAKVLAKVLKPGRETVSAIRISGGKIEEVTEATFLSTEHRTGQDDEGPYRKAGKVLPLPVKEPEKKVEKVVATTVAVPARGCPPPDFPSAELKARAVLSAFLNDEQREDFANYNRFITVGGTTGHRYMVTSRHATEALQKYERSLYDLDANMPICTHDHDVPAAEEMLALHLLVTLPGHESYIRELET